MSESVERIGPMVGGPEPVQPTPASAATTIVSEADSGGWLGMIIQWVGTLLIVMVALLIYHWRFAPPPQRVGVVDISEVLQIKQMQVTTKALQSGENSAAEAYGEIAQFAAQIEGIISALQRECECTLFVKAAVIRPAEGEDLTPILKQRLGIAHLDKNSLMEQMRTAGGQNTEMPLLKEARP